jgi:hypothetical protein
MSLFGIESDAQCREEIDELLELHKRAEQATTKETIDALKSQLKHYYRMGDTSRGRQQMSQVEAHCFWPAIQEAYVRAPRLSSRRTWNEGLYEIEFALRNYRPRD